jgi:hemin uptake protein HemP
MNPARDKESEDVALPNAGKSRTNERTIQIVDNGIDSRDLFATSREVTIRHAGGFYRLRLTSLNKLILTK